MISFSNSHSIRYEIRHFSQNLLPYLVLNGNQSLLLELLLFYVLLNVGQISAEAALGEAVSWSMSSSSPLDWVLRLALEGLEVLSCFWA